MTAEEVFCDLFDKYSEDFTWHMIPLSQSNGDVLYVTSNEPGKDVYYIFSLTYSAHNSDVVPKYQEFEEIYAVKEFIEESLIKN